MQLAVIFGRTADLAQLELEAVAGSLPSPWYIASVHGGLALLKQGEAEDGPALDSAYFSSDAFKELLTWTLALQKRLGGVIRIAALTGSTSAQGLPSAAVGLLRGFFGTPNGKVTVGVSVFPLAGPPSEGAVQVAPGVQLLPFDISRSIKRQLVADGYSVRFVTQQRGLQLSAAQVVHNDLAAYATVDPLLERRTAEFVCIQEGTSWQFGMTLTIQDIGSYTKRDFGIPAPDPESGMLPPKLAQIMINLGIGSAPLSEATVYDPFCGNGRIILESRYMGVRAYGSDIVERKVTAGRENLSWLNREFALPVDFEEEIFFWKADARMEESRDMAVDHMHGKHFVIITEPYLGRPLRQPLPDDECEGWLLELEALYFEFFKVWSADECQLPFRPSRMLVVFPRAKTVSGVDASVYDRLVDRLESLRYSPKRLFCYDRPDSLVRRDLVSIEYKH